MRRMRALLLSVSAAPAGIDPLTASGLRRIGRGFLAALCALCIGAVHALAARKYPSPPPEFFQANRIGKAVTIAPGDVLNVRFYYTPKLDKTVRVREDGKISLDLFQGIEAAGKTPEELQQELTEMYSREFTKPSITVDVESAASSSVFVTGEVMSPGAKEIHGAMTVAMVLALSQVSQKNASVKSVFLIRGSEDGKYRVYKLNASLPDGNGGNVQAAPGDILFVPRKGIVKADDFMDLYARQLLPVTPTAGVDVLYTPGYPSTLPSAATVK